ncbi:hypothetical protein JWG45_12080 [Leptospira sp. 201903070]|uniref:Uncharacterized protein n=1 Tax=Leptospira ainlahdjerensis TaxID=2810033 RepID=A0ABS2UC07_9LEPT|nr:hypothetical protein [Leptospira ainlahdjerensis]MBM9577885.1 hypothetical protein [Leptospira ainlahdjerensis]
MKRQLLFLSSSFSFFIGPISFLSYGALFLFWKRILGISGIVFLSVYSVLFLHGPLFGF